MLLRTGVTSQLWNVQRWPHATCVKLLEFSSVWGQCQKSNASGGRPGSLASWLKGCRLKCDVINLADWFCGWLRTQWDSCLSPASKLHLITSTHSYCWRNHYRLINPHSPHTYGQRGFSRRLNKTKVYQSLLPHCIFTFSAISAM